MRRGFLFNNSLVAVLVVVFACLVCILAAVVAGETNRKNQSALAGDKVDVKLGNELRSAQNATNDEVLRARQLSSAHRDNAEAAAVYARATLTIEESKTLKHKRTVEQAGGAYSFFEERGTGVFEVLGCFFLLGAISMAGFVLWVASLLSRSGRERGASQ